MLLLHFRQDSAPEPASALLLLHHHQRPQKPGDPLRPAPLPGKQPKTQENAQVRLEQSTYFSFAPYFSRWSLSAGTSSLPASSLTVRTFSGTSFGPLGEMVRELAFFKKTIFGSNVILVLFLHGVCPQSVRRPEALRRRLDV